MRFPDDGVTGPNGREARGSAPEPPDGSGGAHGSLMQRYRGAGPPPPGEANPPSASRPAEASESASPDRGERSWGEGSKTWTPGASPTPPRHTAPAAGASVPAAPTGTQPTGTQPTGTQPTAPPTAQRSAAPGSTGPTSAPGSTASGSGSTGAHSAGPGPGGIAPAGGVTVTRGVAPGAGGRNAASTLQADRVSDFKRRWRDVQSDFVDDPRQAVKGADALAREVLDALAATIADRQRVDGWKAGDGSGTEDLRIALRQYRTLVDRLLEL